MTRLLLVGALAAGCIVVFSAPGEAQPRIRRDPSVQHMSVVLKGDFLLGVGAGYEADGRFPLAAVEGDITRLGILTLAYGLADGVLVELRGDAYRELTVDQMGTPLVETNANLAAGKAGGGGDFRVGMLFRLLGAATGLSGGAHLEFNLTTDNQTNGFGTNSAKLRLSFLGSYGGGPFRITADVGVGILEAPLDNFEQNDVLVYDAEVLYRPSRTRPIRLFAGVDGRASTRGTVPVGTEDLGEVRLGADVWLGRWLFDVGASVGYAGNSPDWGASGGVSFLLN